MKKLLLLILIHVCSISFSQTLPQKLSRAIDQLQADSQCRYAIISLCVKETKSNKIIFDKNASLGLAPASCQKVISSAAAFELLGNFTYTTTIGYDGNISNGTLHGNILISGSGDPTFGSWRYDRTKENILLDKCKKAISDAGIQKLDGNIIINTHGWETQTIPRGWIWEDIGNYYGAGASVINWRENQYDIILRSGKNIGDSVKIVSVKPFMQGIHFINELTSGAAGSGDNTIIYLAPGASVGYIRGTIPVGQDRFTISGSMPNGAKQFAFELSKDIIADSLFTYKEESSGHVAETLLYTHTSPSLDSVIFWFLKKSINLYGEALVKTIAMQQTRHGATDTGISIIRNFWSSRGIDKTALNIIDGSGLSPANRVTTEALTSVLQYAKKQKWFSSFYNALPEIHSIKMKSGSIGGVLSYTGYIKNKTGEEYTFAIIINNHNGNAAALKEKMWKVLDVIRY